MLKEFEQKRGAAEREAAEIVSLARDEAERLAAEAQQKIADFVKRRTATAEAKIAQAETQATPKCAPPPWMPPSRPRSAFCATS